jgi:hypothetical protein
MVLLVEDGNLGKLPSFEGMSQRRKRLGARPHA